MIAPPTLAQRATLEPEAATGLHKKQATLATRHMIVAAHPLAADAGLEILRAGGTASDAAIAAQLVLGLVEPQSSGLGGGGFLLHWDAASRQLHSYDGRETAPAAATPDRFPANRPFEDLVASGLSIGVPGVPRLVETVHRAHGRLPWPRLFEPAIRLADGGFAVSPRLSALLRETGAARFAPAARRYFFDADGQPWPPGHVLRNPDFAATLRVLARHGADAFYGGPVADAIVTAVREAPQLPGDMTRADLAGYRVENRPPTCFDYRAHRLCSMGPPSSGGVALGQILGLLAPWPLGHDGAASANAPTLHLIAEAEKLAYADRDRYVADPDFAPVPAGLLSPDYLALRRERIDATRAMQRPQAGEPPALGRRSMGEDATQEMAGTSHLSVVDGAGNAVALTTTIEAAFGARVWVAGFLLNNQLTDFSRRPTDAKGHPIANAIAPGKRPRSSMAPTLVFDSRGKLVAALGSPGGSRIILYVAKALIALIDWRMTPQEAADLANFGSRGDAFEAERTFDQRLVEDLIRRGHVVQRDDMTSGLHIIAVRDGRLHGGADPRREGIAVGD